MNKYILYYELGHVGARNLVKIFRYGSILVSKHYPAHERLVSYHIKKMNLLHINLLYSL